MTKGICQICKLLPIKYLVKTRMGKKRLCLYCFEDFQMNGVRVEILETFEGSPEIEEVEEIVERGVA